MTTTQSKTKVAPTLAQFATSLDLAAGRTTGFTDAVAALASVRARKAVVTERRKAVFAVITEHYERDDRVAGDGLVLRKTVPNPGRVVRSVSAAAIKKHDSRLWQAARVATPYVQVKAPAAEAVMLAHRADLAVGSLPPVPPPHTPLATLAQWYQALSPKDLTAEETAAVGRLRTIGEAVGWDGLPVEFSDGWKVSLAQLSYSDEKLREIAPVAWEALAVERVVGAAEGHVYLGRVGADGVVDLDAE